MTKKQREKFKFSDIKISLPHVIQAVGVIIPLWLAAAAGWHKVEHLIQQVEILNERIEACMEPEPDLD